MNAYNYSVLLEEPAPYPKNGCYSHWLEVAPATLEQIEAAKQLASEVRRYPLRPATPPAYDLYGEYARLALNHK